MTMRNHETSPPGCLRQEDEALPYLYGEQLAEQRSQFEIHLRSCDACRAEVASLGSTLRLIDDAALDTMATETAPGDWESIERRLRTAPSQTGAGFRSRVWLAHAAVLMLVAGASFVAGRQWDVLLPSLGLSEHGAPGAGTEGSGPDSGDRASRLVLFSEQTNDYLTRSRLVLLEFSNADEALESVALRDASRLLLKENRRARTIATRMDDRRLEELVVSLERILREISFPPEPADATVRDRIKAELNSSGVLDQLEILSVPRIRLTEDRTRT